MLVNNRKHPIVVQPLGTSKNLYGINGRTECVSWRESSEILDCSRLLCCKGKITLHSHFCSRACTPFSTCWCVGSSDGISLLYKTNRAFSCAKKKQDSKEIKWKGGFSRHMLSLSFGSSCHNVCLKWFCDPPSVFQDQKKKARQVHKYFPISRDSRSENLISRAISLFENFIGKLQTLINQVLQNFWSKIWPLISHEQ